MILHQAAPHQLVSTMGSKDHPILIDVDSQDQRTTLYSRPNTASKPTSLSLSSISADNPPISASVLSKGTPGTGKGPMWHSASSAFQAVTPRQDLLLDPITHTQDVTELASLKRKRDAVDDHEDAQLELEKKTRKAEKKRRKRERKAARLAQLAEKMPSTAHRMQGLAPSDTAAGSASQHSPPIHLNFDGPPHLPLWGPYALNGPGFLSTPIFQNLRFPHFTPFLESNPHDTDGNEVRRQQPSQQNLKSFPSPPLAEAGVSTPQKDITFGRARAMPQRMSTVTGPTPLEGKQSTTKQHISSASPHLSSTQHLEPVHSERPASTLSESPAEQDTVMPPVVPSPRPQSPLVTDNDSTTFSVNEMIVNKQNLLDRAISENKETLTRLSLPMTPEQKSSLMKSFTERNKFITQLTSEIKAHFARLKSVLAHPSDNCHLPKFKWPETQLPLYVILASDNEESDSDLSTKTKCSGSR